MPAFERFDTMPLAATTREAIARMGFPTPTPIQKLVLPHAIQKCDIFAQAQTGTGKTLAFAVPIVERLETAKKAPQALVLTPTRELARQVAGEIERVAFGSGLEVVAIYGGVHQADQVAALKRGAQIVVGTPGRLMDLYRQRELRYEHVSVFVLDEVDEMLNMGFYEDVEDIASHLPKERQTMFFSATLPPRIQKLGRRWLKSPSILSTSDDSVMSETTEHRFYEVFERERLTALMNVIDMEEVKLGLVFVRTKMEADRVWRELSRMGYKAERLHGDMTQAQREEAMGKFRAGATHVLIATDVAARGIDVRGVTHVFNYHIPFDAESYVHRTGRTGRAGAVGKSITFVAPAEYYELLRIQEENQLPIVQHNLPAPEAVMRKRVDRMLKKIRAGAKGADIDAVYKQVKKEIPLGQRGKALAYLVKQYMDNGFRFLDGDEGGRGPAARGPHAEAGGSAGVRLFVNLGKTHGADEAAVRELLEKTGKLAKNEVLRVDVLERYAFVNVADGKEEKLIQNLAGKTWKSYKVNVEVSKGKGAPERGGRDGGRGGDRGGDRGGRSGARDGGRGGDRGGRSGGRDGGRGGDRGGRSSSGGERGGRSRAPREEGAAPEAPKPEGESQG